MKKKKVKREPSEEIDLLILTQRGNPVAYLKNLEDDSHVDTRRSRTAEGVQSPNK